MSMGPLDMSKIIPIGFDMKNKPWPDHSNVNDPEWADKNVSLDMNAWMQFDFALLASRQAKEREAKKG